MFTTNELGNWSHNIFPLEYTSGNNSISYLGVVEMGQGGPSIGSLYINDKLVPDYRFSGPPLLSEEEIILPILLKSWSNRNKFEIARVDLLTHTVRICGIPERLILLKSIEGNIIYYYNTAELRELKSVVCLP
jgi:hypothetical protein